MIQRYRVDTTKGQWCLKPMNEGDCVLYSDHAEALVAKDASIETWKSRSDRCDQQANMWEQRALEAGARVERAEQEAAALRASIESMSHVLCDPEGQVCIDGSEGDRRILQTAIDAARAGGNS